MKQSHYYGDIVRTLLVIVGITMVIFTPFFTGRIPSPTFFTILTVLVLVILGGLVNPTQKSVITITTFVSAISFIGFEYYAIDASQKFGLQDSFFLVGQFLAILCLIATYFGTKTMRGFSQKEN